MKSKKGFYQVPCTEKSKVKKSTGAGGYSAIFQRNTIWTQGEKGKITITFGDYSCQGCGKDAAWSTIGSDSTSSYPSMNLGFIDPPFGSFLHKNKVYDVPQDADRNYCSSTAKSTSSCESGWTPGATVIHEFCHALGMMHEHQNNLNNSNKIVLNKDAVINYYIENGLGDKRTAELNVLDIYSDSSEYEGTDFDPKSIMLYALPDEWIAKGHNNPTKPNFVLSSEDKRYLQKLYPLDSSKKPEISVNFIDPNPPVWKVAWVEKIISETFNDLIGIKWIFNTDKILNRALSDDKSGNVDDSGNTSESTNNGTISDSSVISSETGTETKIPNKINQTVTILISCISVFVCLVIFFMIWYFILGNYYKKNI